MWIYEKRLQYPVKITQTNPQLAQIIITQFGGPDGELGASMRYLSQRYTMPYKEVTGILTDVGTEELAHLEMVVTSLPKKEPITVTPPTLTKAERVLRISYALLWPSETVAVEDSIGRILASPSVSCPPAVPIVMCGERINEAAAGAFRYYGVKKVRVVKDPAK